MPGKYNFTIYQGATFGFGISWKTNLGEPKDLTGYSARMQIRYGNYNGEIAADLTSENGGIEIIPEQHAIYIKMSAEQTSQIKPMACVYDLEMVKDDKVIRLLEGKVKVSAEVTK